MRLKKKLTFQSACPVAESVTPAAPNDWQAGLFRVFRAVSSHPKSSCWTKHRGAQPVERRPFRQMEKCMCFHGNQEPRADSIQNPFTLSARPSTSFVRFVAKNDWNASGAPYLALCFLVIVPRKQKSEWNDREKRVEHDGWLMMVLHHVHSNISPRVTVLLQKKQSFSGDRV